MARTRMSGPYDLNTGIIKSLGIDRKIGVFALGFERNGLFIVQRIERSDINLETELIGWILLYENFKFKFSSTVDENYLTHCRDYHSFTTHNELDNESHPIQPTNTNLRCPICEL